MTAASWLIWLVAAMAAYGFARWVYRRREMPGRGRSLLAALRGLVIALLLLLVFDPDLPGGAPSIGGSTVIVDASLSMQMKGDGGTRWADAADRARRAGASRVTLFGDAAESVPTDSLVKLQPGRTHSRLLPALRAVAEAGRHEVTVVTDGGIEDADEVVRWLPRLGLKVDFETVGGRTANRGLSRINAPSWVETGTPLDIAFEVSSTTAPGGPVSVVVREQGRERGRAIVESPAPGRVAAGSIRFPAAASEASEFVRYDVAIEGGDEVADDDARSVYVQVSAEPAGAVLVSFVPDWEPRYLLPVLERSLGMPMRGFLRTGTQWLTIGSGMKVGTLTSDAEVRRAVDRAELLVLHAFGSASPDWSRDAAARAPRLLVLPAGDGDVPGLGLPPTTPVTADWYMSDDVPPSPVAQLLAGIDVRDVPPLASLRLAGRMPGTWVPATVSRGRRGAPYPLAVGGTVGARRWVMAMGDGYWRWAFWSDAARDVYERLWSALGGWLVETPLANGPDVVTPARRVIERGSPVRWVSNGGHAPDSVRFRLRDDSGGIALDTMVARIAGDSLITAPMTPGHYAYELRVHTEGAEATGFGEITVESYSDEFTRAAISGATLEAAPLSLLDTGRTRIPLHASLWPYVLLVLLLSVEWLLRRRWGLR